MQINFPKIKYIMAGSILSGALLAGIPTNAGNINRPLQDTFVKYSVPPSGTTDAKFLSSAPNPNVRICGEITTARIVVDLSKNILYIYNENGEADCAYLIASGKPSTPTHSGVRIISHVETYPYRSAPRNSKRRRNPNAYGPKIICVDKLNTSTGEKTSTGEFIHGNNNFSSIGKYASHGCIRMDNDVIRYISGIVKKGDIVIILPNNNK